ncbi:UV DNA damage repair endonuclease UvsE [Melghirimyces algeriensis]|uniref:UV-damage endonuclease n=1 Tax=Melghirimyces algeriensis TaxID=910412 RepID=A0A521DWW0_9BACL|nr:UV DNA damage repair endonuclease UvsE [Melghirimyces algeriensis]SMO76088.1 UV-damage endonuclease [Melghirimyces algeriensis]
MLVRFGFVAMSLNVKDASPSKTMTAKTFQSISDRKAALQKVARIARENLRNTQRILYHCLAHDITFYRFSSKLIPLAGHELVQRVNFVEHLKDEFRSIGEFVRKNGIRCGFHPDHFTVLNSPRKQVLKNSVADLRRHVNMLKAMGLNSAYKCNIHVGGVYGDKKASGETFKKNFVRLHPELQEHLCLENDDKSFTAQETLEIACSCNIPMVLDIHHHRCNHHGEGLEDLWPHIAETWKGEAFPPKVHISSPKSEQEFRNHADEINPADLIPFLKIAREHSKHLDIMIEAKQKDLALFKLMKEMETLPEVKVINGASIEI